MSFHCMYVMLAKIILFAMQGQDIQTLVECMTVDCERKNCLESVSYGKHTCQAKASAMKTSTATCHIKPVVLLAWIATRLTLVSQYCLK